MRDLEYTNIHPASTVAPEARPSDAYTIARSPLVHRAIRGSETAQERAHSRDMSEQREDKIVPPSEPVAIRVTAMPADTNPYGDIFGGWLVSQMDLAASAFASRHSGGRTVTAAIEAISFLRPVSVGDEVSVYACLLSVGRTSMRIGVEAWQRDRNSEDTQRVTKATFTFVALDDAGRPRPVQLQ
ncbi:acyl-CoA thioesterase [Paraburkholderia bannensis]|uniref:acyl-CoA thioesterase n=1 Tax=Paraburkholderia bannensis TaxID=765414 RepID=UPI002ABE13A5|nr:acyl-CoA thioesterase [Paraburkholderia bannensis]